MSNNEVAALFVEPAGVYAQLSGVDPWPESRDARQYAGPHPVVAHPPCQLWGCMAAANYARWGGEHNRPGNDGGCFASALASVRTFGGVLEHPRYSRAFRAHGIPEPLGYTTWQRAGVGEWVTEVWQSAYGHRAQKATWLLAVSAGRPPDMIWTRTPGTHQCGWPDRRLKNRKPTLSKREASATPVAFANALVGIARYAAFCKDVGYAP